MHWNAMYTKTYIHTRFLLLELASEIKISAHNTYDCYPCIIHMTARPLLDYSSLRKNP